MTSICFLQAGQVKGVSPDWLIQAQGSFSMAANRVIEDISNTDLEDPEACRILNERLMRVRRAVACAYDGKLQNGGTLGFRW